MGEPSEAETNLVESQARHERKRGSEKGSTLMNSILVSEYAYFPDAKYAKLVCK